MALAQVIELPGDPYLTASEAASYIGVSVSSLHKLSRRNDESGLPARIRSEWIGSIRMFRKSYLDAYLADPAAQRRRRKSWRTAQTPGALAKNAEPRGQAAGHNMPAPGTTGVLTYLDTSGKLNSVEVADKHIIDKSGAAAAGLTPVSHLLPPSSEEPSPRLKCRDCDNPPAEGLVRCEPCASRYAKRARSIEDIRSSRLARLEAAHG